MKALALLTLCSCASLSLQYGEPSRYDTDCGGGVRLRPGFFHDCDEARNFTSRGLAKIPAHGWEVIYSNEPAGWEPRLDAEAPRGSIPETIRYTGGTTYPATRVIALTGLDERALLHELDHAYRFEHHLPQPEEW